MGYSPVLGRWLEEDPNPKGQYKDGMNLYQFEGSDPVSRLDPTGLAFVDCCKAIAELAAANATLARRMAEATDLDKGHISAMEDAATRVNNAEKKVFKHCGGTAAAAGALEAAHNLIPLAQQLIDSAMQAWEDAGEPVPI